VSPFISVVFTSGYSQQVQEYRSSVGTFIKVFPFDLSYGSISQAASYIEKESENDDGSLVNLSDQEDNVRGSEAHSDRSDTCSDGERGSESRSDSGSEPQESNSSSAPSPKASADRSEDLESSEGSAEEGDESVKSDESEALGMQNSESESLKGTFQTTTKRRANASQKERRTHSWQKMIQLPLRLYAQRKIRILSQASRSGYQYPATRQGKTCASTNYARFAM
jgi:hypothetical protein